MITLIITANCSKSWRLYLLCLLWNIHSELLTHYDGIQEFPNSKADSPREKSDIKMTTYPGHNAIFFPPPYSLLQWISLLLYKWGNKVLRDKVRDQSLCPPHRDGLLVGWFVDWLAGWLVLGRVAEFWAQRVVLKY